MNGAPGVFGGDGGWGRQEWAGVAHIRFFPFSRSENRGAEGFRRHWEIRTLGVGRRCNGDTRTAFLARGVTFPTVFGGDRKKVAGLAMLGFCGGAREEEKFPTAKPPVTGDRGLCVWIRLVKDLANPDNPPGGPPYVRESGVDVMS